jgi:hypothetical protein
MARRRRMRVVYLNGQRWKVCRAKLRSVWGDCDFDKRTIRIHETLAGRELMDTLIHELTHARWPDLQESAVAEFASLLAEVLDAEGFREREDHDA